ncbi:MAG: hypothetical protein KatS3mg002_0852 [Candidatus Woesearchaeota archaeon]|nr:MAG: hypothetical protein KatS3mg002_0852 [Candidatus Woesearchaeota archaeon]
MSKITDSRSILKKTNDETINVALDTLSIGKQAIIFVNTKRSAESIAEKISKQLEISKDNSLSKKILSVLSHPTKQCKRLADIIDKGIAFHHSGLLAEQRRIVEENFKNGKIKLIVATPTLAIGLDLPAFRVIIRDLKRYGLWGMEYIPVLEYHQQAGRAGRPSYDNYGEAIIIANDEKQKKELIDRYINGEPEDIISKLASEPILRTYILSIISSEFVRSDKELKDFFNKTFYAYQYGDLKKLNIIINKIIEQLQEWLFLKDIEKIKNDNSEDFVSALKISLKENKQDNKIEATPLGKRVSELYLDPYTAYMLIENMKIIDNIISSKITIKKFSELTLINVFCNCLELRPLLRVKTSEYDEIKEYLNINEEYIITEPEEYDDTDFFNAIKTSKVFMDWLDEKDEEYILEKYDVRPGEFYGKLEIMDWIIYSCIEISRILKFREITKELTKLRIRLKYGVKEELLPLLKLKNIGRVRARMLFKNGIKDIADVKKVEFSNLSKILGTNIAIDVKRQVGQEFSEEKIKVKENKRKGQISLNDY